MFGGMHTDVVVFRHFFEMWGLSETGDACALYANAISSPCTYIGRRTKVSGRIARHDVT